MKNTFALLIVLFSIQANCQDKTIIKGRVKNFHFSRISIQSDENPLIGTKDEFFALLSDSGMFRIETEIHVPQFFRFYIGNKEICFILICPNSETILDIDSLSYKPASDWQPKWPQAIYDDHLAKRISLYFNKGIKKDSLKGIINHVLELQKGYNTALNELRTKYNLDDCQSQYAKGVLDYYEYLMIWSEVCRRFAYNDEIYDFMNWLPLNDTNSLQSLEYQRALSVFVSYKFNMENGWNTIEKIKNINLSDDEYLAKFHDKILTEIKNEKIRNVMLTRQACNLLYTGSTSAEVIYPKYQKDCSDPYLKQISSKYYKEYLKNKKTPKPRIDTLKMPLFEKLKKYKGKVLYVDFWASWCSPCMHGLPFTKVIQKKYAKEPFEVIYVNVRDNIGRFETTVKKLGLKGNLYYLNEKESDEILKYMNARGIPHYLLIDKNGLIIEKEAPGPHEKAVYEKIDALLLSK